METKTWNPPTNRPWKPRGERFEPRLTFSPLAWLKFQFLCHVGPTEVAAFGLSSEFDPLYLDDVLVLKQRATVATVGFDDTAVADLFDRMADAQIPPARFARVWLHTHPGASVEPSGTDEETFARVFGDCDWSVMAILGRTGRCSARLSFRAGPGGSLPLTPCVDWSDWPRQIEEFELARRTWASECELIEEDPFVELLPVRHPGESFFTPGDEHGYSNR